MKTGLGPVGISIAVRRGEELMKNDPTMREKVTAASRTASWQVPLHLVCTALHFSIRGKISYVHATTKNSVLSANLDF